MRILGFSKKWDKLQRPEFTTFRFPRRDKDWQEGEMVQVVIKPRTKERKYLGIAKILEKRERVISTIVYLTFIPQVSEAEAIADGFDSKDDMIIWMRKTHGSRNKLAPINKLTLAWQELPIAKTEVRT